MSDDSYVRIFDTTLRDGEQSPGATLDTEAKIEIAHQLARMGVDVIEAGFPAASPGDLEAVKRAASEVGTAKGPIIAGLCRAHPPDIDACWEAVSPAAKPRIHTFIATSDIHLEHKLRMTREQVLAKVSEMVAYARQHCADIEFSAEDASRTDPTYLYEVFAAAVEAGATTLNVPDTVGYIQPAEYGELIRGMFKHVPGIEKCIVSVHCHDDLGFATANTLAGLQAGARQAECTINGIGERAGNASLEEIVMSLRTRPNYYNLKTGIDSTHLVRSSHLVSTRTGISVPPNKAIVGANAFAHEAGIHQDGVIKYAETYEIMTPETVGLAQSHLVLGKHSGRHALRMRLEEIGFELHGEEQLDRIFQRFKRYADARKEVTEAELEAIAADEIHQSEDLYVLHGVHVSCGVPSIPTASVSITRPDGEYETLAATGTGPVDAIFTAVNRICRLDVELREYVVHAVSGGIDTLGEVTVRIRSKDEAPRTFSGHGTDADILVASAKAYLSALNKLARAALRKKQDTGAASAEAVA
ncbi:MAG: 2-isopropylmalate synthase [Phycisphaerales bacterium]|nr:2-isopropylmalate synthase [Phycisphaerales bacterium]